MEHGLECITFCVRKHLALLAVCSGLRLVRVLRDKGKSLSQRGRSCQLLYLLLNIREQYCEIAEVADEGVEGIMYNVCTSQTVTLLHENHVMFIPATVIAGLV